MGFEDALIAIMEEPEEVYDFIGALADFKIKYMENYLTNSVMLANLSDYVWGTNAKEGKFTPIAKDDSAACATALLLGKGGYNTDYDLTSDI